MGIKIRCPSCNSFNHITESNLHPTLIVCGDCGELITVSENLIYRPSQQSKRLQAKPNTTNAKSQKPPSPKKLQEASPDAPSTDPFSVDPSRFYFGSCPICGKGVKIDRNSKQGKCWDLMPVGLHKCCIPNRGTKKDRSRNKKNSGLDSMSRGWNPRTVSMFGPKANPWAKRRYKGKDEWDSR